MCLVADPMELVYPQILCLCMGWDMVYPSLGYMQDISEEILRFQVLMGRLPAFVFTVSTLISLIQIWNRCVCISTKAVPHGPGKPACVQCKVQCKTPECGNTSTGLDRYPKNVLKHKSKQMLQLFFYISSTLL